MKIAYFDTIAGISGDMALGAFISAGVLLDELRCELDKLNLNNIEIVTSEVMRSGVNAVQVNITVSEVQKRHKNLNEILEIIDNSSLKDSIKQTAKKIFLEIGKAEASVHNTSLDKIHFHEVGAVDSIIDIVGTAICIDLLGIEKIFSSPIKVGSGGVIKTDHGNLPVPAPAVLEILKGYPIEFTAIPFELTTPTGAGIIKGLSSGILRSEKINIERIGYGAGMREILEIPNLFRLVIGELQPLYEEDEINVVESSIDNMNPEVYPYLIEQLLQHGAYDAYLIPIIMKKGRPGILLSVLVTRDHLEEIIKIIFSETTTLGVRIISVERRKLNREQRKIMTQFGVVGVKVIKRDGKEYLIPEFEECKRIAQEQKISMNEVYLKLGVEISKII